MSASVEAIEPAGYEAMLANADALREAGKREQAIRGYEAASAMQPDRVYPLYWLATLLGEQREYERAIAYGERGLALDPDQIGMLLQMASLATSTQDTLTALERYERARALDPDIPNIDGFLADQLFRIGRAEDGVAAFDRALAKEPGSRVLQTARLFCLNLTETMPPERLADEHRAWGDRMERSIATLPPRIPAARPRTLRIGYVSPDLRDHAVSYFVAPLLEHRDRDRFEHVVFDTAGRDDDAISRRLRASGVAWHACTSASDDELARLIREREIDVLVDLSGHTAGNRLEVFARKPAPVQATWLGYLSTTGLTRMDHRLTDALMDPPGMTEHLHTESLVRLPAQACFAPLGGAPAITASPARATGAVTFGSLNQWAKVSAPTRDAWGEILRRNERARLWIVVRGGQNPRLQRMIEDEFVRRGARAAQIRVFPFLSTQDFLALLGQVDVALDPFPYGGGTTTFQCLWMGLPVIALAGRTALSRNAVGPLTRLGLGDLVADTQAGYVEIADRLGRDVARLERERLTLRDRMQRSILMDGEAFARSFEAACDAMFARACG
ncbi:MAG: tetratricopeptide repeat protein [Burkholderiales bacterium]